MEKTVASVAKSIPSPYPSPRGGEGRARGESILLLGIGILIFLAPIKFGFPADYTDLGFPKNISEWLIFQWPHGIFHIGIIIIFMLWLTFSIAIGQLRIRYSFLDVAILIFLLTAVVSVVKAPNMHQAHLCLTQYFIYVLTYFLILNMLEDEKDFRLMLGILVLSAVLISLYAIYQYYIGLPETRIYAGQYINKELLDSIKERLASDRVFSTFIYPNTLAGYLFLCIPLVLVCRRMAGMKKWLRILIVLIMFYALYLTFYRGSGSVDKIRNTSIFRWEYWTAGIKMIKNYPVFGIGPCNFSVLYPLYKLDIAEEVQYAHNNFLQVWAEQGIFGFLAFCLIWFIAIKKGLSLPVRAGTIRWALVGLAAGLFAFVIHNLVDFDWYVPGLTIIAWVFIGILVRISGRYKEKIFYIKKWWMKGLALLFVILSFLSALFYVERNLIAEYYLCEARSAFGNKDTALSEVLGRASVKMDRDNPDAYFLLAQICVSKTDYANSISWYKKAITYNPYTSAYYYYMGLSYIYQMQNGGDASLMQNAGDAFKKAVLYYPTKPFYHLQLAQFYEASKQKDLAIKEYNYCLELNGKIDRELKIRGKMLKQLVLEPSIVKNIEERIGKL